MKNCISKHFTCALVLAVGLLDQSACGLEVPVEKDTRIEQTNPTANYGGASDLGVRWISGTNIKWTYLHFAPHLYVPAGTMPADISKAFLRIYVNNVTQAGPVKMFYAYSLAAYPPGNWTEGILDGVASGVSTDLCYNNPIPGGLIQDLVFSQEHKNKFFSIDVTEMVKVWVVNPDVNNGIILLPNNATNVDVTFDSKENTLRGHAPKLDIIFNKVRTSARGDVTMGTFTNGPTP